MSHALQRLLWESLSHETNIVYKVLVEDTVLLNDNYKTVSSR